MRISYALSNSFLGSMAGLLAILGLAVGASGCVAPEGPPGADGKAGTNGNDGKDGTSGMDGQPGKDGKDGTSAVLDASLSPIDKAFIFAGGKDALGKIAGLHVESEGSRWTATEGFRPESAPLAVGTFKLSTSQQVNEDITKDNLRLDYTRHITFIGLELDTTFSEIMKGQVGYVSGAESLFGLPEVGNMPSDRWGAARRQNQLLNPQLLLRAAALNPAIVHDAGAESLDGILYRRVLLDDPVAPITLYVSDLTGRIEKLKTLDNNYVARDVEVEVFFSGWTTGAAKIAYPSEVFLSYNGQIVHQDKRTVFEVDPKIDATQFDFPMGAAPTYTEEEAKRGAASHQFHEIFESVGIGLDGPQNVVDGFPIGEAGSGLWQVRGGLHNVGIIEQKDGLVMLDAPVHELRSKAVLAWVAGHLKNKPIKHVILTHFHEDHTGGLREIVAASGADVIVGKASAQHFRHALSAPATVYPDTLSKSPKEVKVIEVAENGSFLLDDPLHPVTAYHVQSSHSADMLMIYVTDSKALWVSDIFGANNPPSIVPVFIPFGLELHDSIKNVYNLDVSLLFTGHGQDSNTFAEFETLLGIVP